MHNVIFIQLVSFKSRVFFMSQGAEEDEEFALETSTWEGTSNYFAEYQAKVGKLNLWCAFQLPRRKMSWVYLTYNAICIELANSNFRVLLLPLD